MEPQEFINWAASGLDSIEEFREEFAAWFKRQPTFKEECQYEESKKNTQRAAC